MKKEIRELLEGNLIREPDWYIEILVLMESLLNNTDDTAHASIEIKDLLTKLIEDEKQ